MTLLNKLLIIKTTALGDVVHNSPMITAIRAHLSIIQINRVKDSFVDILKLHPHINRIMPEDIRRWCKGLFNKQTWRDIIALKWQLQSQQYNKAIDTQGLFKSGWI